MSHGHRHRKLNPTQHGVGRMDAASSGRVELEKSVGRNSSRVYCPTCGAKKAKGLCPRGHPQ